ncbi:hypothetical protein [Halorubellus sp. PRR65]|uniref:DUF7310 family coiled-coil domain-containing protein n=1 Tax=Halorubellus sp. PRR65 TaxID=3098148 RepID=UPI002B259161|nr:hypothetical protein [Halorubellus sp. PRR65]
MSGDFADRLAAVDDALVDESGEDAPGGSRPGTESGTESRPSEDGGMAGRERFGGREQSAAAVGESGGDVASDGDVASEADVAALADRVAELEAAVQALRGYAGSVRAVNDRVEERADAAVATAEDCRERVAALERESAGSTGSADGGGRDVGAGGSGGRRGGRDAGRGGAMDAGRGGTRDAGRGADPGRVDERTVDAEDGRRGHDRDGERAGTGGDVPWPPSSPRAPYGEPDADDDPEQPGLVARLRDAL